MKENLITEKSHSMFTFENGLIGLNSITVFLFDFFDKQFEQIALLLGAERRIYPTLIPIMEFQKTGYLKTSPQYAIFCSDAKEQVDVLENLDENVASQKLDESNSLCTPQYVLSPAACLHVYIEYKNQEIEGTKVITFVQNVFRNEGKKGFKDLGRLRDYHVREIVFIGKHSFIVEKRKKALELTLNLAEKLGMKLKSEVACDPFILPRLQKYKKIQKAEKSKIEVQLSVGEDKSISGSSYNLHGTAFTYPFKISIQGGELAETGCVGFGIERWIVAFIKQFGEEPSRWPKLINDEWKKFQKKNKEYLEN